MRYLSTFGPSSHLQMTKAKKWIHFQHALIILLFLTDKIFVNIHHYFLGLFFLYKNKIKNAMPDGAYFIYSDDWIRPSYHLKSVFLGAITRRQLFFFFWNFVSGFVNNKKNSKNLLYKCVCFISKVYIYLWPSKPSSSSSSLRVRNDTHDGICFRVYPFVLFILRLEANL